MALPVIIVILIALAGLGISAFTAWSIHRWLQEEKTLAFIGRSAAGKTTCIHMLKNGDIPDTSPQPTVEPQDYKIEQTEIVSVDCGGDRLKQWTDAAKRSQGVVYFFDASLVARNDREALSALEADADHIKTLITGSGLHEKRFTLVGTHSDLFRDKSDEELVRSSNAVSSLRLACEIGNDDVVIGSLAEKKAAAQLVALLLKSQKKDRKNQDQQDDQK
jgi:GTPase SAR1 family protein